ncbi:MAG: DEAD/DEAH box helicase [Opitutaceae bacterium]|nr:DEAD/DEAH box helicase [Opitutaceae bacterium]
MPKHTHRSNPAAQQLPPVTDWRTTDADEVLKRQLRAREERPRISNRTPVHAIYSDFQVHSPSGLHYQVEIRNLPHQQVACTCTDFRINGLGTCKHIEAVFLHLGRQHPAEFKAARSGAPSPRIDLVPDRAAGRLRVERNFDRLPPRLRRHFDTTGLQLPNRDPADLATELTAATLPNFRVSLETTAWLAAREIALDRVISRRDYEAGVANGLHPEHETLLPLFPYQREGMLHLAFTERALLADEMGLGKTIQAVAACALLRRLGKASRVLIVTPASLKTEWEEQIRRFTPLTLRVVYGSRSARVRIYDDPSPPYFTIANYEQIVADSLDLNERLRPDIVVLDEAQRIKNWSTRTAQAVKRLRSRYAFVLTGTPIENRIDELRSIVDFLDPALLGPLFRFNRDFYTFDDKGRPEGYQNLALLRERVRPVLLRRRKADVETELPDRTDRHLFVPLTDDMRGDYASYEKQVAELVQRAKRRPLTPKEQDLLMVLMNMMRMICDTPAIIKSSSCRDCPKLDELARVLDEVLADSDVKVIVFSEWEGMLTRVRELADKQGIGYAWHTGSVPQKQRRAEILAFRQDPGCRLFLSTDSGGVGLNLQNASVVINCDLPWNPAKLEQRIARAWRKNQLRPVTVVNLIAENTIEHGMLGSLATKQELAQGVLDGVGDLAQVKLKRGRQDLLKRLEQVLAGSSTPTGAAGVPPPARPPEPSSDPAATFAESAGRTFGPRLIRCDETWLAHSDEPVLVAVVQGSAAEQKPLLASLLNDTPWRGPRPSLHVLDASAWEALQALAGAGLLTLHARATRPLLDRQEGGHQPTLSEEQRRQVDGLRALAQRKARAARALLAADLAAEAAPALREAVLATAQAGEISRARPAPETLKDSLRPPLGLAWPMEIRHAAQALEANAITDALSHTLVSWLLQA